MLPCGGKQPLLFHCSVVSWTFLLQLAPPTIAAFAWLPSAVSGPPGKTSRLFGYLLIPAQHLCSAAPKTKIRALTRKRESKFANAAQLCLRKFLRHKSRNAAKPGPSPGSSHHFLHTLALVEGAELHRALKQEVAGREDELALSSGPLTPTAQQPRGPTHAAPGNIWRASSRDVDRCRRRQSGAGKHSQIPDRQRTAAPSPTPPRSGSPPCMSF